MLIVGKRQGSAQVFAEMIVRIVFPHKQQIADVPLVERLPSTDGQMDFFCFEHQFDVVVKECGVFWHIYPQWHSQVKEDGECEKMEQAIATLHSVFRYSKNC